MGIIILFLLVLSVINAVSSFISVSVGTQSSLVPQCNNGQWALFGFSFQIFTTTSDGILTVTNPPMAENGACNTEIDTRWYLGGVASPITVISSFNFGTPTNPPGGTANPGPPITSGNELRFSLQDNMSITGGSFLLAPNTPCTSASVPPIISISFSNPQVIVMAPGNGMNIPAVNAVPAIVNALPIVNQATGTNSGGATILSTTTTGVPSTQSTALPTTANSNIPTTTTFFSSTKTLSLTTKLTTSTIKTTKPTKTTSKTNTQPLSSITTNTNGISLSTGIPSSIGSPNNIGGGSNPSPNPGSINPSSPDSALSVSTIATIGVAGGFLALVAAFAIGYKVKKDKERRSQNTKPPSANIIATWPTNFKPSSSSPSLIKYNNNKLKDEKDHGDDINTPRSQAKL